MSLCMRSDCPRTLRVLRKTHRTVGRVVFQYFRISPCPAFRPCSGLRISSLLLMAFHFHCCSVAVVVDAVAFLTSRTRSFGRSFCSGWFHTRQIRFKMFRSSLYGFDWFDGNRSSMDSIDGNRSSMVKYYRIVSSWTVLCLLCWNYRLQGTDEVI